MNKTKLYLSALVGAVALSSCGDFLEPNSTSEFVPEDITSLNEMLLGEAYPRKDRSGFNIFLSLMDDDITAAPWQALESGFDENKYLAAYSWQPDMFDMMKEAGEASTDMYLTYYTRLKGANAVLDYIDTVTGTENEINNVKAQAYALRGFFYLNLVNIFGQPYNSNPDALGVPLKITSGVEEEPLRRSRVKDIYAQIISDLQEAERLYELLPTESQWKQNYRTSLPMTQVLLSRTYLYMENWEEAAKEAKKVMDNATFRLLNLNDVPTETTSTSGQTTRSYINYHSYTASSEVIWPYGNVSDWAGWVEDYSETGSSGRSLHAYFRASDDLLACFDDKDLRKERYIIRKELPNEEMFDENTNLMPLAMGKLNVNTSYRASGGTGIFGRSIRLAEAYLNYMEAKAMIFKTTGNATARQEALDALNTLRENRFSEEDFVAEDIADADELITFIHNERRRELCFESHRWYDLRRWGMPEIKHVWYPSETSVTTYTLTEKDPLYTIPIPDVAIEKNANLEQNEVGPKRTGITTNK